MPYTAWLAVSHATRQNLDDIEVVLAQAEQSVHDKDSFSKWDGEFHLLIAHASGNPLLINVYRQINHVRLHAQFAEYNRQHRSIFNALKGRNAQKAQALISEHLEKARDDLLKANSP